ncbi:MAG TPA: class I SAM-dependent methyltransferase [Bacillota bacterium]|nr:class I SAM-dependent methyltransferase [Bacillota bacterium]
MPLLAVLTVLLLLVAFTVFFGPPYVPVLRGNMQAAFELLQLKPGQTMLELGSGDGRVLIAAARQGIHVVGIELSPLLVLLSWLRTRRYRKYVKIIWGNYFTVAWPEADAIFAFMIQRHMGKLDKRITRWHTHPVRLASVAFEVPGKHADAKAYGVFLYRYK